MWVNISNLNQSQLYRISQQQQNSKMLPNPKHSAPKLSAALPQAHSQEPKTTTNPQSNIQSPNRELKYQLSKISRIETKAENQSLQLSASQQIQLPPSPSPIKMLQNTNKNLSTGNKQFEMEGHQIDQFQDISANESLLKILQKDSKSSSKIKSQRSKISSINNDKSGSLFDDQSESNLLDSSIKTPKQSAIQLNEKNLNKSSVNISNKNQKSFKSRPPIPPSHNSSPTLADGIKRRLSSNQSDRKQVNNQSQQNKSISKIKNSRHVTGSSRQIILQAQIIQLQMKCSYMMGIIHKLNKQIVDSSGKKLQINLCESIRNMYMKNNQSIKNKISQLKSTQIDESSLSINSSSNVHNNTQQDISDLSRERSQSQQSQQSLQSLQSHQIQNSTIYNQQIQCFNELQSYIQAYKKQLQNYQEYVKSIQLQYKDKVELLEKQIQYYQNQVQKKESQLQKKQIQLQKKQKELEKQMKSNKEMVKKNEQLIIQMEKIMEQKNKQMTENVFLPSYPSFAKNSQRKVNTSKNKKIQRYQTMSDEHQSYSQDQSQSSNSPPPSPVTHFYKNNPPEELDISVNSKYSHMYRHPHTPSTFVQGQTRQRSKQSFSLKQYQECLKEMQTIIEKLVKNLQYELKYKDQLIKQINRLCQCIKKTQIEIKNKNQRIYNLQKQLLVNQAQQMKRSKKVSFSSSQTRSQSQPQYNDMYGITQSLNQSQQSQLHQANNMGGITKGRKQLSGSRSIEKDSNQYRNLIQEQKNRRRLTQKQGVDVSRGVKNKQQYQQYMSKLSYNKANNPLMSNSYKQIKNQYDQYCWNKPNQKAIGIKGNLNNNSKQKNLKKPQSQAYPLNKPRPSLNGVLYPQQCQQQDKYVYRSVGNMNSKNKNSGGTDNFNNYSAGRNSNHKVQVNRK